MRTATLVWLISALCAASAFCEPLLDTVVLGNAASERAHALVCPGDHVETGALGQRCRRLAPGERLSVTMACDPVRETYLTVKLWGGEVGAGQLHLYEGKRRVGRYLHEWPELDLLSAEPAFPGRFYYSTYLLPRSMTQGRTHAPVVLGGSGQPTPYSTKRKEAEQRTFSRGIYCLYTGADPFFVPPKGEAQGVAPNPTPFSGAGDSPVAWLRRQLDKAVTRLLTWQYYGREWEALVAAGRAPASLTGEINTHGLKDPGWTIDQWRNTAAQRMGGNRVNILVVEIYARAYQARWSKYYHNAELVDRVVKALDYFRVAQGSNGGFDDIWAHKWVGGPRRRRAGNCLEGFGQQGLGAAFLTLRRELTAASLLDEPVDEDGNPDTPAVSRRQAWANLFEASRNYLTSPTGRGHAPNQDMVDQLAAYLSNRALRLLAPARAWSEDRMRGYLYSAAGSTPDIYGGRWLSRKGLSLEPNGTLNGGFCGNYGPSVVDPLFRLAELTGDRRLRERALQAVRALAFFQYPSLDAEGHPCLRLEGVTTWRNNKTPGRIYYGANPYAAAALKDPLSLRQIQLAAADRFYSSVRLDHYWAHFVSTTASWLRAVDRLEQALALPPTPARLPFEPGQPDFAWADEEAGAVVVKHGDARLVMSLNWRHGFGTAHQGRRSRDNVRLNNLARVHYTTSRFDRLALVRMKTLRGFQGLSLCRYGPFLVAMNASPRETIDLPVPADLRTRSVRDLMTERQVVLPDTLPVEASSTRVFWLGAEG